MNEAGSRRDWAAGNLLQWETSLAASDWTSDVSQVKNAFAASDWPELVNEYQWKGELSDFRFLLDPLGTTPPRYEKQLSRKNMKVTLACRGRAFVGKWLFQWIVK